MDEDCMMCGSAVFMTGREVLARTEEGATLLDEWDALDAATAEDNGRPRYWVREITLDYINQEAIIVYVDREDGRTKTYSGTAFRAMEFLVYAENIDRDWYAPGTENADIKITLDFGDE